MEYGIAIQLHKDSNDPLYVQLYKSLKLMIENGEVINGEKLPPIRKMAEVLDVNNSTVVNAYKLLENNGYAYSRVGSGTFICSKSKNRSGRVSHEFEYYKREGEEKSSLISSPLVDFTNSTPDPSLFPVSDFKKLLDYVLDRDGGDAFGYTEVKGYKPLRECLSVYMREGGIYSEAEDIYITSGAQQGIDIISKVLVDFGDVIITEKPTYTGAIAVFKSRGAKIADIPLNENGIDIFELENTLHELKPKFIYLMTNFQNPTGFSYSKETMERLLYLAEMYNFFIIEDDYLSELYYSEEKPLTLKSMDQNDRVIYIKSFSKTFMPGARLGFLVVPKKLQDRVLSVKYFSDISSSGFMQRVFDLFIRSNMFEDYISHIREEYKKRYFIITDCIDRNIPGISYFKPNGGIHLWIKLNDNLSSNIVCSECLTNGALISPGSVFFVDSPDSQYFRLNYASLSIDDILKGISIVGNVIQKVQDNKVYLKRLLIL